MIRVFIERSIDVTSKNPSEIGKIKVVEKFKNGVRTDVSIIIDLKISVRRLSVIL